MYYVQIEGSFESAHRLNNYRGKCENIHGHNFKVRVQLKSKTLNKTEMVEDFIVLEKKLQGILNKFDHQLLNDISPFDKINPTAEKLAEFIFKQMQFFEDPIKIHEVQVFENDRYLAIYRED